MGVADFNSSKITGTAVGGAAGKSQDIQIGVVELAMTTPDDFTETTEALDKYFSEVKDANEYEQKNGMYYGAIKYRLPANAGALEENLPTAFPLNRYNFTLPVRGETVRITNINGRDYYEAIQFQNTPNYNTNMEVVKSAAQTSSESTKPIGTATSYREIQETGITNTEKSAHSNIKVKDGFNGKYYKRNPRIHQLKPNEGDTIIQSKSGNSIRFTSYAHTNKDDGAQYPAILIRNGESIASQRNTKVFGVTTEDVNGDNTSIHITSGEYKSLFKETINVSKEASPKYPSSDELKGDQLVLNTGRIILSSKLAETFIFSKKNMSIFTDDVFSIDSEKGGKIVSQNGAIAITAKNNNNIIYTVDEGGKIFLGKDGADQQGVLGNKLVDLLKELIDAIINVQWKTPSGPTPPKGMVDQSKFDSIKGDLDDILSKINYLI